MSALIDKLITQTDTKPAKEDTKYKQVENNNGRAKLVNDSNIIYLKLLPSEIYNMTLHPNASTLNENNPNIDNKNKESGTDYDPENSNIERNIQNILNSTSNKDVLKKILHELKKKIDINKPKQETEHKLRTPNIENSMEEVEQSAYQKNRRSGFVDLLRSVSPPDIILSKNTFVLNDDANIENMVPDILTTIKKQIPPLDVNDIKELLKNILETKQTKDENLSSMEFIPSRRRYSSNEVTSTKPAQSNLLTSPSLLGSLNNSPKTILNNPPLNLCGKCKHLGLVNVPLNNLLSNNAMLQKVMRRNFIGNFVNTIRPNVLYKHFNGIFK